MSLAAPFSPVGDVDALFPGTFYLAEVDHLHRRQYLRTAGTFATGAPTYLPTAQKIKENSADTSTASNGVEAGTAGNCVKAGITGKGVEAGTTSNGVEAGTTSNGVEAGTTSNGEEAGTAGNCVEADISSGR